MTTNEPSARLSAVARIGRSLAVAALVAVSAGCEVAPSAGDAGPPLDDTGLPRVDAGPALSADGGVPPSADAAPGADASRDAGPVIAPPDGREPNPDCLSRPPAEDGRPWCDNTGPTHFSRLVHEFAEGMRVVEVTEGGETVVALERRVGADWVLEDSPAVTRDPATGLWVVQDFVSRGKVTVDASDVVLRNFRIHGSIDVSDTAARVQIVDGEIRDFPGAAIGGSHFRASRLHVHHGDGDFINADSDLTIERSYFHNAGHAVGSHADAIQYGRTRVGRNVTYRENFFYMPFNSGRDGRPPLPSDSELSPHLWGLDSSSANAILQLHTGNADLISDFLFEGNWFHGTNSGVGVSEEYVGSFTFVGNRWECNEVYESGTYVVRADLGDARWMGNVHYNPRTGATLPIAADHHATHGGGSPTTLDCTELP